MEEIAAAFEAFQDRHGHFFRTRTRHNAAVARRYLRGLAQAEECTFESMAAVVEDGCAQQFQHFISNSPWDHEPVVAQIGADADRLLGGKPTSALILARLHPLDSIFAIFAGPDRGNPLYLLTGALQNRL